MNDQVEEKLRAVIPIREVSSKHDIVWKGKTFKLDIISHGDGFLVGYFVEEEIPVPGFVKTMMKAQGDKIPTHMEMVNGQHVCLKPWERWFGFKIERKIQKTVDRIKKEIQTKTQKVETAEEIKKMIM